MTWIIAGAVFFLLFLFLGIPVVTDTTGLMTGMLPAVLILLASAIGFMAVGIRQRRKITRRKAVQYQLGAADAAIFTHITGLPLADGAECNVLLGNGEYIFPL